MKKEDIIKKIRKDYRCPECNRLIFKGKLWGNYDIEYICPRCKNLININKTMKGNE